MRPPLPLLKLLLASLNMAVLCLVMALLVSQCSANDIRSWGTAFHILALLWLLLRGAFWTLTITTDGIHSASAFYLLYWAPNPLQFANFLLLPLFYGQVVSTRRKWATQWRYIRPVYIAITTSMVVFMAITAIISAVEEHLEYKCLSEDSKRDCYHPPYQAEGFRVVTTFCFFALAVIVAAYGIQMARLQESQHRRFLIYEPRALAILNSVLFSVFLSKGIYQLCSTLNIWYLPNIPLQGDEDISPLNFIVFCWWDYLPTVLLLLVVTNRGRGAGTTGAPAGGGGGGGGARSLLATSHAKRLPQALPDYGLFREIKIEAMRTGAAGSSGSDGRGGHSPFGSTILSDATANARGLRAGGAGAALAGGLGGGAGGGGGSLLGSSYGSASPSPTMLDLAGGSWRWGRGSVFDDPNRYWVGSGTPEQPSLITSAAAAALPPVHSGAAGSTGGGSSAAAPTGSRHARPPLQDEAAIASDSPDGSGSESGTRGDDGGGGRRGRRGEGSRALTRGRGAGERTSLMHGSNW
ncbi:hypothetical protein JKP88DRAFT_266933 [Tribonema minus]|uniref:Uncharacterized protein n=1 Tax=Tribonema minus TaxID=303371 RepID=A0A835ZDS8_9STRA|nr:hypothetical protein JKP88DRAFT_266933 [Tribonema minus]